jgi:quercetin dioxygenase-like cupin family protein
MQLTREDRTKPTLEPAKETRVMTIHKALITTGVVACVIGLALVLERSSHAPGAVTGEQLLVADLAGEPGKEANMQVYTFPPGASVPWHTHPDAHEFDYELEGTLTLQIEGQGSRPLKQGEAVYVAPNVLHRGLNVSRTQRAKVVVVRVKPKDQPLTTEAQP